MGGVKKVASKGDDWPAYTSERRCHWLPYLKEMRRAEEGSIGGWVGWGKVKKDRKKGSVILTVRPPQKPLCPLDSNTHTHTHR